MAEGSGVARARWAIDSALDAERAARDRAPALARPADFLDARHPPLAALPERETARTRRWLIALLAVAHLGLWWHLDRAMALRPAAPRAPVPVDQAQLLVVEFIAPPAPAAIAPPPPSRARPPAPASAELAARASRAAAPAARTTPAPPPRALPETTESDALAARFIEPDETPSPLPIYRRDGSLNLSPDVMQLAEPRTAYRQFRGSTMAEALAPHDTLRYERTRFEREWKADRESLPAEIVRRGTVEREFRTAWGTTLRCAALIVPIFGGCSWDIPDTPLANPPEAPEPSNPIPPPGR